MRSGAAQPKRSSDLGSCRADELRPGAWRADSAEVVIVATRRQLARLIGSTAPRIPHGTATLLANNGMPLEEVSRHLEHSSTDVTRRHAHLAPDALGCRAAEALERAGLVGVP
jgi:integrase